MAQPYVGEIRMFAGNFAPAGWMFCEGQLLPISENETLFQLIGTTYGGDGQSTFASAGPARPAPDPPGQRLHPGGDRRRRGDHADGQPDPAHIPSAARVGARNADSDIRGGNVLGAAADGDDRSTPPDAQRRPWRRSRSATVGGSQPHTNFQPYLCVDFIISLFGIFPSPT